MAAHGASSYYHCTLDARNACTWNNLVLYLDASSMLSVLFVNLRAAIACYRGERRNATAIERMLCMWTFALLTCDLLYHAADVIFMLDKDTSPLYVIMTKSAAPAAELQRTTVHDAVKEGVGLCCIWCHCNISCAMFRWIVRKSLMGRRLRVRLSIILVALAVSALRISLIKLGRKDTLMASLLLHHALILPFMLAFAVWTHMRTLAEIKGEDFCRALRRHCGRRSPPRLEKQASSCNEPEEDVEMAEQEGLESPWPRELTIAPAMGEEMGAVEARVRREHLHREHQLVNNAQFQGSIRRIVCGVLALWLTGSVTELVVWGWWVTSMAQPSVAVFVLQIVASRLIGLADAVVMGHFCVVPRNRQDTEAVAQHSTEPRVVMRFRARIWQKWSSKHRRHGQEVAGPGSPPAMSPEFMYVPSHQSRDMWSPYFSYTERSHSSSNQKEGELREAF